MSKKSAKSLDQRSEGHLDANVAMAGWSGPPKSTKSSGDGSSRLLAPIKEVALPPEPPDIDALCVALQEAQIERKFSIQMEMGIVQRISARVVRATGIDHAAGESSLKAAWKRAERIVRRGLQGKSQDDQDQAIASALSEHLMMAAAALAPVSAFRDKVEAFMRAKAESLPAFSLTARVAGFNSLGLAVIIGEAGNLSNYASERKLWRRLGLATAPGHEAHAYSTWKRLGLPTGQWDAPEYPGQPLRAGYAPKRLGQVYGVVTVPLFMHKAKSRYGEVYAARQAHTALTHPRGTAEECKLDPIRWTPKHAQNDGMRVMTKALISDLWSEWRGPIYAANARRPMAPAALSLRASALSELAALDGEHILTPDIAAE